MDQASSSEPSDPQGSGEATGEKASARARDGRWHLVIALAVVAAVVTWVFWPMLSTRAFFSDDYLYVGYNKTVQNPSWASTARFLREVTEPTTVPGYYEPWPMISFMLDVATGGDARKGERGHLVPFRRTALALHVVNSLLASLLIYLIFREPFSASVVGLLFGLHPLQVESVVWISQRKTLMATLFVLASMVCYVRHAQRGRRGSYVGSVVLFLLALMSKPTALPLPMLLVIMDVWPLRRLSIRTLIEKIPFFALALVGGVISMIALERTATLDTPGEVGWGRALLILCHNIVFYLQKVFWPSDLSAYYPFPEPMALSHPAVLTGVVGTGVLTVALLVSLRWTWAFVAGWAFFFVAIFPAMGVFKVTIVIAADRYVYLPIVGLGLTLGWLLSEAWRRSGRWRQADQARAGLIIVAILPAAALARATQEYLKVWRDNETIFRHMVRLGPDQIWIRNGLANALVVRGRFAEATKHFAAVVEQKPDYIDGYQHLAAAYVGAGMRDQAIRTCRRALDQDPNSPKAYTMLAGVLNQEGRYAEAAEHARRAAQADPDFAKAHYQLGVAMAKLGRLEEASAHLTRAIELSPEQDQAHLNLAAVLARQGDLRGAIASCRRAVELAPRQVAARNLLGQLLLKVGRRDEARQQFLAILDIHPRHGPARKALQGLKPPSVP